MGDRSQVAIVKRPRRSDATFWADGTTTDHAYWGQWQARRWKRAGWKKWSEWAGFVLVSGTVGAGMLDRPAATERVTAAACGLVLAAGALRGLARWEDWGHYRAKVRPLYYRLAPVFAISAKPQAVVEVPRDYAANEDAHVVIYPPPEFTGHDRDREDIERAVTVTLPEMESPDFEYRLASHRPRIVVTHSAPPPLPPLGWKDTAPAVAAAGADDLVLGIGRRGVPVTASLATDSPHAGIQAGSGGGKTNLGSFMALQFLHRGDICCFIDAKLISFPWARSLPNVSYAGTIPEIHDLLVWLGGELRRRNEVSLAGLQPSGAIHANVGARLLIFAEELNYVIPQLKDYWADARAADKALPKRSPALAALGAMAFAGRQVKMHEVFVAQMLTAAATGAADSSVRGNIGISCMARYRLSAWQKMTDLPFVPCPDIPGRIQAVTAVGVREAQVPYLHLDDPDESVAAAAAEWARDYATGGVCAALPAGMPGATGVPGVLSPIGQPFHASPEQPVVVGHADPVLTAGAGPMGAVTLAEAVAARLFVSIDAARQARQRQGWEPVGGDQYAGYQYALKDLQAYVKARRKR